MLCCDVCSDIIRNTPIGLTMTPHVNDNTFAQLALQLIHGDKSNYDRQMDPLNKLAFQKVLCQNCAGLLDQTLTEVKNKIHGLIK
jgi:recombinational DNA repair protein RecR